MVRAVAILFLCILISICTQNILAQDKMPVYVSIVPQKYFVQQIGKYLVDVQVMVPPGASPATYEPKPRQMADLSKTKLYLAIGVPFENIWLKKIAAANPKMNVVPTDHAIRKISMAAHHHHDEEDEHHENGEHSQKDYHHQHGGLDPHIWLSPPLVMIQARMILSALQAVDPNHRNAYAANYKVFISEIIDLDLELTNLFAGKHELQFMVFHPAWGYFAQVYGLEQIPVEIEGKDPKPSQLRELIEHAREKGIKVVFVQPQFSTKSADLVAKEIGGQVAFADPLAENWSDNLREVADKFRAALK